MLDGLKDSLGAAIKKIVKSSKMFKEPYYNLMLMLD